MGSPGITMKLHLFLSLFLSLPFCKEFDFNPFKIKDKIAGVIGLKKAAKNFIVTEVKNVREKFARKSEKINQIKKFFGDVIDTKAFFVRGIPDLTNGANRAAGSAFSFLQGLVPTTPSPPPQRQARPRFNSRFR